MTELNAETIRQALCKAAVVSREQLSYKLCAEQTDAICRLIEECAESVEAVREYPAPSREDIRISAYDLAIKTGTKGDAALHKLAGEIADRIIGEKVEKAATNEIKLNLEFDASGFQAAADKLRRHAEFYNRAVQRYDDVIGALFNRIDYRNEGWNDCKAVMIRAITRQISDSKGDGYVLDTLSVKQLDDVRRFISSFHFDPSKP